MKVRLSDKIIFGIMIFLLFISIGISVYLTISTYGNIEYDICTVTECNTEKISYQWSKNLTYHATFIIPLTWTISCSDSVACLYSHIDPYGTFGAWVRRVMENNLEDVCINGACLIESRWYIKLLYVSATICVCISSLIIFIIIKIIIRRRRLSYDNLYSAISYNNTYS